MRQVSVFEVIVMIRIHVNTKDSVSGKIGNKRICLLHDLSDPQNLLGRYRTKKT